jgi:hypothetical protein
VPVGDVEGLGKAMQSIRSGQSDYSAGEIARYAAEHYGIAAVVRRLKDVYIRVLAERKYKA